MMFTPLDEAHQQAIVSSPWSSAIIAAIEAAGIAIENNNIGGWQVRGDPALAHAIIDNPATWLPHHKKMKLAALRERYAEHFDHHKLADASDAQIGPGSLAAHWAQAMTRFRVLKAAINAAPDAASVDAIDITAGWPATP